MFLIINIGSTSVKTKLFDENLVAISQLSVDYSALINTVITTQLSDETAHHQTQAFTSVEDVLRFVFAQWQEHLQKQDITLTAVGHRIVHGGPVFHEVIVIDRNTLDDLAQLDAYAPLHNPINRLGITFAGEVFSMPIRLTQVNGLEYNQTHVRLPSNFARVSTSFS